MKPNNAESVENWSVQDDQAQQARVRDLAERLRRALGGQVIPQPVAELIGGPHDGKMVSNARSFWSLPDPPPTEYKSMPPGASIDDIPPQIFHRWDYVRETRRPCYSAEVVSRFVLSP